jgi:hypothetical protein
MTNIALAFVSLHPVITGAIVAQNSYRTTMSLCEVRLIPGQQNAVLKKLVEKKGLQPCGDVIVSDKYLARLGKSELAIWRIAGLKKIRSIKAPQGEHFSGVAWLSDGVRLRSVNRKNKFCYNALKNDLSSVVKTEKTDLFSKPTWEPGFTDGRSTARVSVNPIKKELSTRTEIGYLLS